MKEYGQFRSREQIPRFDFLDENNRVSFEVEPDALDHLPTYPSKTMQRVENVFGFYSVR